MPDPFDPYAEWLGLTRSPQDYYELLGLAQGESDLERIAVAADTRSAKVRSNRPGSQARAWQHLLDELAAAKRTLLDAAAKAQYDAAIRSGMAQPRPTEPPQIGSQRAAEVSSGDSPTDLPQPDDDPMSPVDISELALEALREMEAKRSQAEIFAHQGPANDSGSALGSAMPLGGALGAVSPKLSAVSSPPNASDPPPGPPAQESPAGVHAEQVQKEEEEVISDELETGDMPEFERVKKDTVPAGSGAVALGAFAALACAGLAIAIAAINSLSNSKEESGAPDSSNPAVAERPLALPPAVEANQPSTAPANISPPSAVPEAREKSSVPETTGPKSTPAPNPETPPRELEPPGSPTRPSSEPASQPEQPAKPPASQKAPATEPVPHRPAQTVPFDAALRQARGALAQRELDIAQRHLEVATKAADSDEQKAQLDRARTLHELVANFWKAVREGSKGLETGAELKVNNTPVAVVESSPELITIHIEGTNRTYSMRNLPMGLAMVLAERGFDPAAATTKLSLGAFQLVEPNGDAAEAKRLWEEAALAGADAESLMPLLTESRTSNPELQQLPDESAITAAVEKLQQSTAADRQRATSEAKKIELAQSLLKRAAASSDAADQVASFRMAGDLAGAGGNAALMLRAIDDFAQRFPVDSIALKQESLERILNAANRNAAKSIAHSALRLADEQLAAQRSAEAARFADLALRAARKGQDSSLAKQASQRIVRLRQEQQP